MRSIITLVFLMICQKLAFAQIQNFDKSGRQVIRFSTFGDAVDAHDGEIAQFNGTYYLYGTSYDCGFQWGNKDAPFCGFKVYTSKDLSSWTDRGFLFDAQTQIWQSRCNGKTYGCFRPHVIYNQKTKRYVLWINVYDNVVGYRVFTSKTPIGPFTEVSEPKLAVNSTMPAAGLNNGDHDTFVDDDGTAYLAYTDWRTKGTIVIEKLSADYLTGTGQHVKAVTTGETEAPGMFKRNGIYYVVYSDPNCGYCSGTGTSYRTARSPLGPWSVGKKISDNSCGGQPSFVSTVKINAQKVYLYGSDLWNNAAKNEALANYYWAPLTFSKDGSINPLTCKDTYWQPKAIKTKLPAGNEPAGIVCDVNHAVQRSQSFTATQSGFLSKFSIIAFKNNNPEQGLEIAIYAANDSSIAAGTALYTKTINEKAIGWSVKNISVETNLKVEKGHQYVIVFRSDTNAGCYGFAVNEVNRFSKDVSAVSDDGGKTFKPDRKQILKLQMVITSQNKKGATN